MFFNGRTHDPHPHMLGASGLFYKQLLCACGVAGLLKNIFLPFFILIYIQFFHFNLCHADTAVAPQVCHLDNCVKVEVVSKTYDLERGLMYRTSLDQDKGMLFVFTFNDRHQFWMKNMHFDLDILWISTQGRIVYIGQNIPACRSEEHHV